MNLAYGTNWSTEENASATVLICHPYIGQNQTEPEKSTATDRTKEEEEEERFFCFDLYVYSLSASTPNFYLDIWKGNPKMLHATTSYTLYY